MWAAELQGKMNARPNRTSPFFLQECCQHAVLFYNGSSTIKPRLRPRHPLRVPGAALSDSHQLLPAKELFNPTNARDVQE